MDMKIILGILLTSIFSKNFALIERLGTGAVLETERSSRRSLTLGLGTTLVMVLSTLITWPLNKYVLEKVPYMQTMAFVLVVLVVLVGLIRLLGRDVGIVAEPGILIIIVIKMEVLIVGIHPQALLCVSSRFTFPEKKGISSTLCAYDNSNL